MLKTAPFERLAQRVFLSFVETAVTKVELTNEGGRCDECILRERFERPVDAEDANEAGRKVRRRLLCIRICF